MAIVLIAVIVVKLYANDAARRGINCTFGILNIININNVWQIIWLKQLITK